jgi:cell division protein FtsA
MRNTITGLDIGTSKICAAITELPREGSPRVLGVGVADSRGINKGFVSSLDKLTDSISKAIHSAQESAGIKAHRVVANISGASVSGNLQEGLMLLARRGREIKKRDVRKVVENTKNVSLTMEKDLLCAVPQEFIVDDSHEVEDPLGLYGTRLKVRLYVVTAQTTHVQNISKAVNYAGYELVDIAPTPLASASGMLSRQARKDGVILIDIGGGVTEVSVFKNGIFKFFDSVNVGGMDLTSTISSHFKVPFEYAETIKRQYGGVSLEDMNKDQENIFDADSRHIVVKSNEINKILDSRFDEIFHILSERLKGCGWAKGTISNITVTGGGALLHGALESFERRFDMPVNMGSIESVSAEPGIASNPVYAAAISLGKYGLEKNRRPARHIFRDKFFIMDTFYKFRELIEDYF